MNAVDHTIQKIVEEISGLPGVVGSCVRWFSSKR